MTKQEIVTEEEIATVVIGRLDALIGHGLAHVLDADPRVRLLARDLDHGELERIVSRQAPDVAILDEVIDPLLLTRLRSSHPATGVLVLVRERTALYQTLLQAVGAGCLPRYASTTELLVLVRVAAGLLTPRETEVLALLGRGRSNAEIALVLQIGVETVRTYVARVIRKLEVQNRQELHFSAISKQMMAPVSGFGSYLPSPEVQRNGG